MDEPWSADNLNPYESPREQGYVSLQDLAWWAWLKDRLLLWGCGLAIFITIEATVLLGVAIAWLLGYPV